MNLNAKTRQYADKIFRTYSEDVDVFLKNSQSKGNDFHPYYNQTLTKTNQNSRTVKAMIRDKSADSLIMQKIGLIELGAKAVTVQDMNVSLFKLSEKIVINEEEYTPYNKAVGNKFTITDVKFGYSTIILFIKGT